MLEMSSTCVTVGIYTLLTAANASQYPLILRRVRNKDLVSVNVRDLCIKKR